MDFHFHTAAKILGVNLSRNFLPYLLTAFAIVLLAPVICGISGLQGEYAAQPLERFLCLSGPVLLTPVFWPEHNENIRDVIRARKTDYLTVCALRVVSSLFALAFFYGGFVLVMRICESEAGILHFVGGYASALFLGAMGFCAAGGFDSPVAGYMVSMVYYILNFVLKEKLGPWFLFSQSMGSFEEKYWLLGSSAVLILLGFAWTKYRLEKNYYRK